MTTRLVTTRLATRPAGRFAALALALTLLTGGCSLDGPTDDPTAAVADEDLFALATRMVRDVDAAVDAAAISDVRRRRIAGPVPCEGEPQVFRGGASVAGYVTDGSSPTDILARVREVWEREGGELAELDTGDDIPTIARRDDDGVRYEAAVLTNRPEPLLTLRIDLPCAPVPAGYEDPDGLFDALYDDYLAEVDPGGEQIDEALDPAP